MEIYVQSCAIAQDRGYRWIDENLKIVEEPNWVKQIENLIESEANSIVLARKNKELLLLITGLESSRKDYRGRIILNSVAWIVKDTDEAEAKLRAIAVSALRGWGSLQTQIDKAITELNQSTNHTQDYGFEVDFTKIKDLYNSLSVKLVSNQTPQPQSKINTANDYWKNQLVEELEKYSLPKQSLPLVVVTGIKSEDTLKEAEVWRGLSTLVVEKKTRPPKNIPLILLSVLLITLAVILIVVKQQKETPTPQPTASPIQKQSNQINQTDPNLEIQPKEIPKPQSTTPPIKIESNQMIQISPALETQPKEKPNPQPTTSQIQKPSNQAVPPTIPKVFDQIIPYSMNYLESLSQQHEKKLENSLQD